MRLVFIIEVVLYVAGLALIVTQIAWPLLRGTPPFPFFRRERKLREEIAEVRQGEVEHELEREIETLRKRGQT